MNNYHNYQILLIIVNIELLKEQKRNLFFFRNNYNMLLTPHLELFLPYTPKHFVHREMPIQL